MNSSKLRRHTRNFAISALTTFVVVFGGKSIGKLIWTQSSPGVQNAIAATSGFSAQRLMAGREANQPVEANIITGPWQEFSSEDLGFDIEFPPGDLREDRQTFETHLGDLRVRTFSVDSGSRAYTVTYTAFPNYMAVMPAQTTISSAIEGILANVRQRVGRDREIESNGYPGYEMRYEGRDGLLYQHQIYVVDRYLFQIVAAAADREESFATDSERFFSSFKFLY
ncbi:MAG: hypothetical protein EAZ61_01655 [Oscillatoriales cyanobacterium]|nr:MAG: hypothetical protein EAZ61_01655 [Oscillatoriales cyanobacterium]